MNTTRSSLDWVIFAALCLLWASAYAMTRGAVYGAHGLPVELVLISRLVIGAIILNLVMLIRGHHYPGLRDTRRWLAIIGMGFIGMTGPFYLVTTAQQTVASSLAALYVAATPIFVVIGANFLFSDEKLTARVAVGIGVGFVGVIALFGPDAYRDFGSASVTAQLFLLVATSLYASSTLLARAAPKMPPLVFASGFVTAAMLFSLPLLTVINWSDVELTPIPVLSTIGLGIGPSAIASMLYMALVQRAGATFLSLTGYVIPILSAIIGYALFREIQSWNAILAFALILTGVWLAQRKTRTQRSKA